MNPAVDTYISNAKSWQDELRSLRRILLDCGLREEFKWRQPCYMYKKTNIVLLFKLKDGCALGFLKGALLQDTAGVLIKPGENSQSGRWIKFTSMEEINRMAATIKAYVFEAIEVEKAGLKVDFKGKHELVFPEELIIKFDKDSSFKAAFEALTPGRQRGYNLHFSAPKQSQTRQARIEKYVERIIAGKGIHDCICGLSKKMPNCEGSHKSLC
jgi:uncharacterized protein YdeI (YjbR/CyaY-like superfamily)